VNGRLVVSLLIVGHDLSGSYFAKRAHQLPAPVIAEPATATRRRSGRPKGAKSGTCKERRPPKRGYRESKSEISCSLSGADPPWQYTWTRRGGFVPFHQMKPTNTANLFRHRGGFIDFSTGALKGKASLRAKRSR
jgi:hypothetical protein